MISSHRQQVDFAKGEEDQGHYARRLTREEVDKLKQEVLLSDFQRNKLETQARKNWDLFYKRNATKFFKDRNWTKREFEQLIEDLELQRKEQVLIELGCGVGNFFFPLIRDGTHFFVYACDFSPRAIQFIKSDSLYDESKCRAFVADLTDCEEFDRQLETHFTHKTADVASLIFVLSAISPDKMGNALRNAYKVRVQVHNGHETDQSINKIIIFLNPIAHFKVLRPGGHLLVRDYGLYDHAMLRFKSGHKIDQHFYVRQDGTRAFYFSEGKFCDRFGWK